MFYWGLAEAVVDFSSSSESYPASLLFTIDTSNLRGFRVIYLIPNSFSCHWGLSTKFCMFMMSCNYLSMPAIRASNSNSYDSKTPIPWFLRGYGTNASSLLIENNYRYNEIWGVYPLAVSTRVFPLPSSSFISSLLTSCSFNLWLSVFFRLFPWRFHAGMQGLLGLPIFNY